MAATFAKCHQNHRLFRSLQGLQQWFEWNLRNYKSKRGPSGQTFYEANERLSDDPRDPDVIKRNEKLHPETPTKHHIDLFSPEPLKGKIVDKLPFRIKLEAGKQYAFCTCGYSKQQPFCDSSHKAPHFMSTRPAHIKYRPIRFKVEETKEYWLCQCKQSNNRPFCDGTHKRQDIQETIR